jgi:hypothetical protein
MQSSGPAPDAPTTANNDGDAPGEATLLVSEFPPPPFYYALAATLTPPAIPKDALARGTQQAAAAAARARAESERLRLSHAGGGDDADKTDAILGGVRTDGGASKDDDDEGEVVGVFGEIVEVCFVCSFYSFGIMRCGCDGSIPNVTVREILSKSTCSSIFLAIVDRTHCLYSHWIFAKTQP